MPFRLTNTSSTFMRLMNHVLCYFIGNFIVVYFDDFLIYNKNLEEHVKHLKNDWLFCEKNIYANLKRCDFCKEHIVILRYVNAKGIQMNDEKVSVIQEWSKPKSITKVRSFHSLASFYTGFVKDFNTTVTPLIEIVKKYMGFK